MAVPATKDELLQAIEREYGKLKRELGQTPFARWREKTLEGHATGTWISIHDLIAYLVGWNELVLKWHELKAAGEPVDFPETGYKWNELGRLAQSFYRDCEMLGERELLERLDSAKSRIVALIEQGDGDTLYGRPWYEKWTQGRMIQFNTSSPYANACGRLRKWRRNNVALSDKA
ncbi:ClbS/DfsB family four-helix bundle protein [Rhizobium daejeonense]|uniref:ClbS/DfsB family four-helix bundle protein n=1 Tax=Rhizobium daejeonense TaxID=240521 RepID=A0A6M1RX09_9HYPH|nr:ClbS/DfsB family four-helix bundle protein [Rhizobium daejeonense]NGO62551.1 ClbS/DfsB family four-helix bundle protein [Rhizobium daejeonense]